MTITLLELHCLNALCDDYETASYVKDEVRKATRGNVTDYEIRECLIKLINRKFVDAFDFSPAESKYVRSPVDDDSEWLSKWFFITEDGRNAIDENWFDDR